ncbi:hypothetical protein CPC08DRAFT_771667 [Agrocybe pediades]|nr:hypothetical protein CPC08DRAFT_771667 [Agrocybe pediades]
MFYSSVVLSPSQHLQSPSSPATTSSTSDIGFISFDTAEDIAIAPGFSFDSSSSIQAPISNFDTVQPSVSPVPRFNHCPSVSQLPQSPHRLQPSYCHTIAPHRRFSSRHRRFAPHRFSLRRQPSKRRRHRSILHPRHFAPRLRPHRFIFAHRRRPTSSASRFTPQTVASFIEPSPDTPSTPLRPPAVSTLQDRPPRARLRHSIASTRRPSRRYHLRHHIPSSRRPIAALLSLLDPTASLRQVTDSFYHFDVTSFVSTYFSPSIPRFDVVDTPFDRTQTPSQPGTHIQAAPG